MPRADRDAALAAELDAYLDALATESTPQAAPASETSSLATVAQRIRAMAGDSETLASERPAPSWTSILALANGAGVSRAESRARPIASARPRWWIGFGELATAAAVLLTLLGGFAVFALGRTTPSASDEPEVMVYAGAMDGSPLKPLDPVTLLDATGELLPFPGTPTAFGEAVVPTTGRDDVWWLASADGSTLVGLVERYSLPGTGGLSLAVVFDLPSGRERSRFEVVGAFDFGARLTDDGRRLVVATAKDADASTVVPVKAPTWTVYDTETGDLLIAVTADLPAPGRDMAALGVVDGRGERLYALSVADEGVLDDRVLARPGPWPTKLTAYDLTDGSVVGTLDLHWVVGRFRTLPTRPAGGGPAIDSPDELNPALALSPDGRRLAVVSGDGSTVTLVDTSSLTVERTRALPPGGTTAPAAEGAGAGLTEIERASFWFAAFTPDGTRVLVSGLLNESGATTRCSRFSGLLAVDVEDGSIEATGLSGLVIVPAQPPGESIYVWSIGATVAPERCVADDRGGPSISEPLQATWFRLDAATLAPEASRSFPDSAQIVVVPVDGG